MILDATAGNRTIYETKNAEPIIYIDIEKQLKIKPTIFADNTKTPFQNNTFDTIIYDPPQDYGRANGYHPTYWKEKKRYAMKHVPFAFTYYGWDKYKTRIQLITHIYKAQKELHRILKNDGLLWVKWNEIKIPLQRVLTLFSEWHILLKLYIKSPTQTAGTAQTYWICLCKKNQAGTQISLMEHRDSLKASQPAA